VHVAVRIARADRGGDVFEDVARRWVDDGVHGVEAQAVEVILLEPVERVVDEKLPHRVTAKLIAGPRACGACRKLRVGRADGPSGPEWLYTTSSSTIRPRACAACTKALRSSGRP
jgi:hypothetical protein